MHLVELPALRTLWTPTRAGSRAAPRTVTGHLGGTPGWVWFTERGGRIEQRNLRAWSEWIAQNEAACGLAPCPRGAVNTSLHLDWISPGGFSEGEGTIVAGAFPADADAVIRAGCHRRFLPTDGPDGDAEFDGVFDPREVGLSSVMEDDAGQPWHVYRGLHATCNPASLDAPKAHALMTAFRALAEPVASAPAP